MNGPRAATLLMAAVLTLPGAVLSAADGGCREDPSYQALSHLVGRWTIVSESGAVEGAVEVRSILDGCAFEEVREEVDGERARALIVRDPISGEWEQHWASNRGDTARLALTTGDDGSFTVSGEMRTGAGDRLAVRSEVRRREAGGFLERLEISLDGTSWEPPKITEYRPEGVAASSPVSPEPAVPAPPVSATPAEPAPPQPASAPSGSRVTVRSSRTEEQPPAETIALDSPMTLELELGPLDALPAGTAWRTKETAVYLVGGDVRLPQVSASRRERRRTTELEVTVNLRTTAVQRRVDLEVELLSDGESLGIERVEGIALGKLIMSHDPRVGRATSLRFALEEADFEALFENGRRPSARITVTVK